MPSAPWRTEQGLQPVLDRWLASAWVKPCFCADETFAPATGRYARVPEALGPGIVGALRSRGVDRLYEHQHRAVQAAMRGKHVVIATPTASGKSLCFHLPVLQALQADAEARAMYLFPTKALARDQEASLLELMKSAGVETRAVVYDGDTPADARRAARERSRVVLTNPDMLHAGVLPHHASWSRLFRNLRYVVVDELHTYRGVFGSHVANVLRRLLRVARFHGANPVLLGATATIGNPRTHASRLFGVTDDEVVLVDESGAPRGERRFFLFNPPVVNGELGIRASYVKQAVMLASDLVRARVPTIVFGHSRSTVEVMLRYLRDAVGSEGDVPVDASQVMAYRGGYLPAQRRDIERRLREGEIVGVVATNALELGIDIGELDAVICAGYPGSIAATWQRFGRAGRRGAESVCVLVSSSAPLDQYLAREPSFLLGAPVEEARIDPDNVEVLVQHVKCAAFELPFKRGESFGSLDAEETAESLSFLARHAVLHEAGGTFHWAADAYPANDVSLRSVGWDNVVIIDLESDRSIAELDWPSAHTMLHEQAIYQHDGECWQVERFDYENHKAFVRRVEPDYWTTAMTYTQIALLERSASGPVLRGGWSGGWGEVSIVEKVVGYKKIKFYTHENAGYGDVRLPEMQMHTTAFWITVPSRGMGPDLSDALRGIGTALETVATLTLMCDPRDLGTAMGDDGTDDADGLAGGRSAADGLTGGRSAADGLTGGRAAGDGLIGGRPSADAAEARPGTHRGGPRPGYSPTLFVYEHVPGGTGLAERIWEQREVILERTLRMIETCPCAAGCPACVGPTDSARKAVAIGLLRSAAGIA